MIRPGFDSKECSTVFCNAGRSEEFSMLNEKLLSQIYEIIGKYKITVKERLFLLIGVDEKFDACLYG